jgi:hypothetical protein
LLRALNEVTTNDLGKRVNVKHKTLAKWWRIWAKSLGEKVGETDKQANTVAGIRTIWWLTHMVTCIFIIAGNVKALGLM